MRDLRGFAPGLLLCSLLAAGCTPKPARPGSLVVSTDVAGTVSIDYPSTDLTKILKDVAAHFHLKLDGPYHLYGRTSLTLRDVTWRQIFEVTLAPVGYDFYERDGVVIVRPKAVIDALPDETRATAIKHQSVAAMIGYLNRLYAGSLSFAPTEAGVVYRAHPRRLSRIATEIARVDQPGVVLKRFPRQPRLPERLPDLAPVPLVDLGYPPGWSFALSDRLQTEVLTLEHIDPFLVKPYLDRELTTTKGNRVLPDILTNALIITAPEQAMPRLAAIVAYLDDKRWYAPEDSQARDIASLENAEEPASTRGQSAESALP